MIRRICAWARTLSAVRADDRLLNRIGAVLPLSATETGELAFLLIAWREACDSPVGAL